MAQLTLEDLVANGTMSAGMVRTLRKAVEARRSYLVIALPRLAGKTTVGKAILAVAARVGAPVRELGEDGIDVEKLALEAKGGYLYVPEVSTKPVTPGYVWGEPVRKAFAAIGRGTALSTALHADSADDALEILRKNEVPAADLARLDLIVHIRSLGDDLEIAEKCLQNRVVTVPGVAFGDEAKGFLRISFCNTEDRMAEGVTRMKEALT